jgi:4a-hydroxytetrahydrobiopterin dehydratase
MSELIAGPEMKRWIKKAPEWEVEKKYLTRTIEFDDFMEGIDFVNDVAEIAEEASHHPDIDIRWCKITLRLTTHDQGGITDLDFELASRIDTLVD